MDRSFHRFRLLAWFILLLATMSALDVHAYERMLPKQQAEVVMRSIGHQLLLVSGDNESRVLPVRGVDGKYVISFASDLSLDPGDVMNVVREVMDQSGLSQEYLVEVRQCDGGETVHSFEVRSQPNPALSPCAGRILPNDCYELHLTLLDVGPASQEDLMDRGEDSSPQDTSMGTWVLFMVPLALALGFLVFVRNKKDGSTEQDTVVIGATTFDRKNMTLSYQGTMIELSHKESELLHVMHRHIHMPMEREFLLQEVWGDEGAYVGRTLDVFISKLRKKLEADESIRIVNIRGVGYKLIEN